MIKSFTGQHRFLSNFYTCKIIFEGETYYSVENAYQAAKTVSLEDRKFFCFCLPARAKSMGKTLIIRPGWDLIKISIMEKLLRQKFSAEPFKSFLKDTKNEILVEENTWKDQFWGTYNSLGRNELGKILMKIRSENNAD